MFAAMSARFDYVSAFKEGGRYAEIVAARLKESGVDCYAPPIQIATNQEEREFMTKYETDIEFYWMERGLEVKSSSRIFTDAVDEYPYETLFVDTVSGFDAKVVKPVAYIFVSQKTGGMVCLSPKTKSSWNKVDAHDSKRNIDDCFYSVSKLMLQSFDSLVSWLLRVQEEALFDTETD